MLQATQLDSERQPNSNSGVTPNCHRAAPRKSREQRAPHKTQPAPPRPCMRPPPSLPLRLGGGSESQGPWVGLIPASKKSFPPGTCSESEHGVEMGPPTAPPRHPARSRRHPPGLQLQGALLPGHQEGVRELGVTQLPHLLGYREGVQTCPAPARHAGVEGWGLCPRGHADARDGDGSWLIPPWSLGAKRRPRMAPGS